MATVSCFDWFAANRCIVLKVIRRNDSTVCLQPFGASTCKPTSVKPIDTMLRNLSIGMGEIRLAEYFAGLVNGSIVL
jgi:hypothetical protein